MPILCHFTKNRRRKETKGTPLGTPTSNSALQCASWEYHSHKRNARRSNTTTFGLFVSNLGWRLICSGINSFRNIHIESKTKKNKRLSKTKNDKLPNVQREGRCLPLARIIFAYDIPTTRLKSAELEGGPRA